MNVSPLLAALSLVAVLAACSDDDQAQFEQSPSTAPAAQEGVRSAPRRQAPVAERVPHVSELDADKPLLEAARLHGGQDGPGNGLELPIFASDRAEYRESLRLIAEDSSDEQYQQLDAALKWLLINDSSIMNDEQRLFETVHGKTGSEVLALVADQITRR